MIPLWVIFMAFLLHGKRADKVNLCDSPVLIETPAFLDRSCRSLQVKMKGLYVGYRDRIRLAFNTLIVREKGVPDRIESPHRRWSNLH